MCRQCDQLNRRALLAGGLALLAAPALAAAPPAADAPNAISPAAALQRLTEGNARYAAGKPINGDYSAGRAERASAQYPIAAIVSCADSRVAPELIFDQGPGQLFVVRVAGNFVNGAGLASLEYAVQFLGVPLILVLGHSGCGAISSAIKVLTEGAKLPGHLPNLIEDLKPGVQAAIKRKPKDVLGEAIAENVRYNVGQLRLDQPVIAGAVASGKVGIRGGTYDIATGRVTKM